MLENQQITVGAAIAEFLEHCAVKAAFGVISIHNMPILDAMFARGKVRWVMARGEAGAGNMADAFARTTSGLGVCITSTGPAAGNIAGSLVEAYTAGVPLLHITGQIAKALAGLAHQPAHASAERESGDAGLAHDTAGGRQPEGLGFVVKLLP